MFFFVCYFLVYRPTTLLFVYIDLCDVELESRYEYNVQKVLILTDSSKSTAPYHSIIVQ